MSNDCQEDDSKVCVDNECYKTTVTPKRCTNSGSPLVRVTWQSRDRAILSRGQRSYHRTPVRVVNSASNSSGSCSSSSSGTSEHSCNVYGHQGTTQQWFLGSPRVQQLKDSEGRSNLVLESDLKGMRLAQIDFSPSHESTAASTNQTANTPKKTSAVSRTFNPFELDLVNTMHLSSFSPSVFSKVGTPSKDEQCDGYNFSWGIDNIAVLYPGEFDDAPNESSPDPKYDQEVEDQLQHAINKFFHTACVPSPWPENRPLNRCQADSLAVHSNCGTESKTSNLGPTSKTKRDASCQTMLTLPNNFDLQLVLESYYTYTESQAQNDTCWSEDDTDAKEVLSMSSLRRKLFANDEEQLAVPSGDTSASPETIPISRNVSPMRQEPIPITVSPMRTEPNPINKLPHTPDQCASSPLREITDRHQRTSLTPPTIISPTVSPIRVLVREIDEVVQEESDADVSFMSTCQMQSMVDCRERFNLSQSPNSSSYLHQSTCDQYTCHKNRETGLPVLESVDEAMEPWNETTADMETAPNFKMSFMETTTDNSCVDNPSSHFISAGNHDTGYQTNTNPLQFTISSNSDTAASFSTSIQAPVLLWHKKAVLKCSSSSQNQQNVTDLGKSTILTNIPDSQNAPQKTLNGENIWSPLVSSTPSRSKLTNFLFNQCKDICSP